ncbi:MAG TPA: hypothetical protein VLF69_00220 [Candidatus Saccharimonadales bacterium]|nr:hypothetical protein [Candidatus Saccharimonadales bacterium]
MKRRSIISKPTAVDDLFDLDVDSFSGAWELKAERLHAKQQRKFRHQLS